jgi:hypothetical protein
LFLRRLSRHKFLWVSAFSQKNEDLKAFSLQIARFFQELFGPLTLAKKIIGNPVKTGSGPIAVNSSRPTRPGTGTFFALSVTVVYDGKTGKKGNESEDLPGKAEILQGKEESAPPIYG